MLGIGTALWPAATDARQVEAKESDRGPAWSVQASGVEASLRGLSVVSDQVAWASGSGGTVIRTVDGGQTWTKRAVSGGEKLDFRDIHAFDDQSCVIVNAGSPAFIYRTEDGGQTWREVYRNEAKSIFFDALAFWDGERGMALSDPQEGRFLLIRTTDGGTTWTEAPIENRPEAHPGEAAFAASGTCLIAFEDQNAWIATGGEHGPNHEAAARVLASSDGGVTWSEATTPLTSNESSGIFSIAFANVNHGVVVGGDYKAPEIAASNVAITDDSGRTWRKISGAPPAGYRSGVAVRYLNFAAQFVAVGPTGTDISVDWGDSWREIDSTPLNAVAFSRDGKAGWAVGPGGTVAKWVWAECPYHASCAASENLELHCARWNTR
jgi:photosystem II stability/assembly factor-like uncharacterized protein